MNRRATVLLASPMVVLVGVLVVVSRSYTGIATTVFGDRDATLVVPGTPTPLGAYPPPAVATISPNATWMAESREVWIQGALDALEGDPSAEGPFTLIADADVLPQDAPTIGIPAEEIQTYGVPDIAIIVEGTFWFNSDKSYRYLLGVYNKGYGRYHERYSDNLDRLLAHLP